MKHRAVFIDYEKDRAKSWGMSSHHSISGQMKCSPSPPTQMHSLRCT